MKFQKWLSVALISLFYVFHIHVFLFSFYILVTLLTFRSALMLLYNVNIFIFKEIQVNMSTNEHK